MLSQQQLDNRILGIGGSDVPSILRIPGAFKTPLEVYLEKVEGVTTKSTEAMQIGQALEPLIFEKTKITTNINFEQPTKTLIHPAFPSLIGNLDGISDDFVLEIKVSSNTAKWANEVDRVAEMQIRHYMSVANKNKALVVVLLGTPLQLKKAMNDQSIETLNIKIFQIERDERIESAINTMCDSWWSKHCLKKCPPPLSSKEDLTKNFVFKAGKTLAQEQDIEIIKKIASLKKQMEAIEKQIDNCQIQLSNNLNGNNELISENGETLAKVTKTAKDLIQTDLLKAEMPEIFLKYAKKTTFNTLRIK